MEDRGRQDCVGNRWQSKVIIVLRLRQTRIDAPGSVDEFFNGDVAVATLAVEMSTLGRSVLHAGSIVKRMLDCSVRSGKHPGYRVRVLTKMDCTRLCQSRQP